MKPSFIQHAKTTKSSSKPKTKHAKKKQAKTKQGMKRQSSKADSHVPPPRARPGRRQKDEPVEEDELDQEPGFFASLIKYTFILGVFIGGAVLYIQRDDWGISRVLSSESSEATKPKPTPEVYAVLIDQLESQREQLKQDYLSAGTDAKKQEILGHASYVLEETLPQMMRCWLGHPYDFNGTATIPGEEKKIACGYFVSVIMRDAGS